MRIKIQAGITEAIAELGQNSTAEAIWNSLPLHGKVSLWGYEIYFKVPLHVELEDAQELVKEGDLGFWPTGDAFCIFFGATPISKKGEIRPASAVNVFGRIVGENTIFKQVKTGDNILIERV